MLADVMGTTLSVPDAIEASGLGAAQLGLFAMGEVKDFNGIHNWVKAGTRHVKHQENHDVYKRLTPLYQKVYHQLSREFDEIAAFQKEQL
jgi:gluconokinase